MTMVEKNKIQQNKEIKTKKFSMPQYKYQVPRDVSGGICWQPEITSNKIALPIELKNLSPSK